MGIQGPVSLKEKPWVAWVWKPAVDACALCPLRFAVLPALGVLGAWGSAHPLRGSWAPLCCPLSWHQGRKPGLVLGRLADWWAFHPVPGAWPWRGVPGYPGSKGRGCALPHGWGGLAVVTTRTGWARAELGPALGEGVSSCLWSRGRRGPGFGVQRPCALSCPVTVGRLVACSEAPLPCL